MPELQTSGTTGRPKRFLLTSDQIAARAARRASTKGAEYGTLKSIFVGLSANSSAGHAHKKWAESKGVKFFGPTGDFEKTIALLKSGQVEGIVTSPAELLKYAVAINGAVKFKYLLASGSRLTPEQSKAIRAGLGDILYCSYGASEVGTISLATSTQVEAIVGCVGKPCIGTEVRIESRELQVKTPTMIAGYHDKKLTAAKFTAAGWFKTGDLAEITADGLIVLKGRAPRGS